ncbi:imidazole glycerol phosphate synthase subunit HisH [Geosporobacter ferrireducens]|uniref:Imidazole glycerol phosphate synthase subunit HisH n=1 Tax=Geosporobacter ferrireducens TaxID=1424294 RepID=A0A1D8GP46_9FIRM|nr:imidazole glycerol phosphate synthase subunit HisH [Geosporobacter ferrireducens]AOT72673.1 imidazole glycerol phosphate synthase, glutamine amidotransferase subunit [Geosporobacter ferrireducens]MTI55081.1 imidazole glycerol phosphate synthase subunit HisH [Geosporobacter ferrireducens]
MIAIIDYGVGNLKSVYKALNNLGLQAVIATTNQEIHNSAAVILPGVGAFKDAIIQLSDSGLIKGLTKSVAAGKPVLGICLGMQLLFDKSFEDGEFQGLGFLKGEIHRFEEGLKVPHMGWNHLKKNIDDPIGRGLTDEEYVYFVHSYYLKTCQPKDVVYWCNYGTDFPAIVRRDNIIGMQFHPEKSGKTGIQLLKNFGEMIG